jgi:hypothetical protein
MMARTPVATAIVQASPAPFGPARIIETLAGPTSDAAGRGANIMVSPEALVGGKHAFDVVTRCVHARMFRFHVCEQALSAISLFGGEQHV